MAGVPSLRTGKNYKSPGVLACIEIGCIDVYFDYCWMVVLIVVRSVAKGFVYLH